MDIVNSIKKPFTNIVTLIIGGVLSAIPIISILAGGFILKTAEDAVGGKSTMRSFAVGDIVEYIIKVILAAVISIVYLLPGLIICGVGIGAALFSILPTLQPMIASGTFDPSQIAPLAGTALASGGVILLIGVLVLIIAGLLLPMAIMRWLSEEKFGAAFNVGTVVKKTLTVNYLVAIIVYFVYAIIISIIAGIIAAILGFIPVVGWILIQVVMGLVAFILGVTSYDLMAQVYNAK